MSQIINCRFYEEILINNLSNKILELNKTYNITPSLCTILVGENAPSIIYVKNKTIRAKKVGITVTNYHLSENTSEKELLKLINELNTNNNINAILVQMPLPKHLNTQNVINAINPIKDVDGLHPLNAGYLLNKNLNGLVPCTPLGILYILKKVTKIAGKNAVVIGRSNLVGLPIAMLLNNENATVTVCHSHTTNLKDICKRADIVIAAVGKANFITSEYLKDNAVVIDVGINRVECDIENNMNSSLSQEANKSIPYIITGDVNTNDALNKNVIITPVPNGVGRLTIVFLLYNTYKATLKQYNIKDDSYDLLY